MANCRNLKKDINYLVNEVVSDCLAYMFIHPEKNKEKAMDIVELTIEKRNQLIAKVSQAKKEKDPKKLKQMFTQLKKEMFDSIDASFLNLSQLTK